MSTSEKKTSSSAKASSKSSGSTSKAPSKEGKADHVIVRNLFALTILRRQVVIATFALIAAVLSVFSAYQVMQVKTPPQYIQLTEDGRIFPIAPLNVESASDGEILNFATESVKWVNTYDYKNWRDQLQAQSHRFTVSGWDGFVGELVSSDNLNTVQSEGLVVSAEVNGEAVVEKKGVVEQVNSYVWRVKVPVSVSYSSLNQARQNASAVIPPQKGVVTLYITRVPLEVNLRGYAIQIYQFKIDNPS